MVTLLLNDDPNLINLVKLLKNMDKSKILDYE